MRGDRPGRLTTPGAGRRLGLRHQSCDGEATMSKGMDRKKETKKKPARTKEEKKAAKKAKK